MNLVHDYSLLVSINVLNLHFTLQIVTGFRGPLTTLIHASTPFFGISSGLLGKGSFLGSSRVASTHSLLDASMQYFTAYSHKVHNYEITKKEPIISYVWCLQVFTLCSWSHTLISAISSAADISRFKRFFAISSFLAGCGSNYCLYCFLKYSNLQLYKEY